MAGPITGEELKQRGPELPTLSELADDHGVAVDGLASGAGFAPPAVFSAGGIGRMTQGSEAFSNLVNPRVPVVSGGTGTNFPRRVELYPTGALVSGAGLYLGAKSEPPVSDNFGGPLQVGNTYFNLTNDTLYVFSSAGRWTISAAALPSSMRAYYYPISIETTLIPPGGPNTPDAYGNILSFDVTTGQVSQNNVNVYMNGVLLVNGTDYTVTEGGGAGDYITLTEAACVNSFIVVQFFSVNPVQFSPNSVSVDTSLWVYDGVTTSFEMFLPGSDPSDPEASEALAVTPGSPTNLLVVKNGGLLKPAVEFTVSGNTIIFALAPEAEDDIWIVAGLPTAGASGVPKARSSPFEFGGRGDGISDDTTALAAAINEVNVIGSTLDLSGGTWRITEALPDILRPRIEGSGSGEIYVDFDPGGTAVLRCYPPVGDTYDVIAVEQVTFNPEGTFGAPSTFTRLTLDVGEEQAMPIVGSVGKLSAEDQVIGGDTGDFIGQHLYFSDIDGDNFYVYSPILLLDDNYATSIQLSMLYREQVVLRDFSMRGNWDRVVAEDWLGSFIQIVGAFLPKCENLAFQDGAEGLVLMGCWMASTRSIRATNMRNATESELPPIPGYGVVDGGSFMSYHSDLGGSDCRHLYTTIAPNPSNPRITWGRCILPMINGGQANGCSNSAYDTHADCISPVFANLTVYGGYYGEQSGAPGIQFRGNNGLALNCRIFDTPIGFYLYRQHALEQGYHRLINCGYSGLGIPIYANADPGLSHADALQHVEVRDFIGETINRDGIRLHHALLHISGIVRIVHSGLAEGIRAIFCEIESGVNSIGDGLLVHDVANVDVSVSQSPRLITYSGANCGSDEVLNASIRTRGISYHAIVSDSDDPTPAPAGQFLIDAAMDLEGSLETASGGYSLNGVSNLLPAGTLLLRLVVAKGRGLTKSGAFNLRAEHNQTPITCTAAFTITIPAATILGPLFKTEIYATGGTVVLDGPGGTNLNITNGSVGFVQVVNGVLYAFADNMTVLS